MKDPQAFKDAYASLNEGQKKAVDSIDGPVFVIAGPGTGKTQVLTLRIANILQKTDTPPDALLALTFTEAAAAEMRSRLAKIIGSTAWKIRIHTFHGFAESLISHYPDQFPRIIGAEIATDAERAEIVDEALHTSDVKHLRPYGDPLYYHGIVARAISVMKREHVTLDALETRVDEEQKAFDALPDKMHEKGKYRGKMKGEFEKLQRKIEKTGDLLAVYRAYEEELTKRRRYDFDDLILEVVRALQEDEGFLRQVQESILYVLADEHQDANRSQNALLELISDYHERPNIFIVGDEKQAIYRFQGADLDNVHYFKRRYKDTSIITLVENYRSTQTILDSALSLIDKSPDERLSRVALVARAPHVPKPISLIACPSPEAEMAELSARIHAAIAEDVAPGDIAVLVRRNKDVADVAEALMKRGILVSAKGEGNALHNQYVLALIRVLLAAAEPRDEHLSGILTLPAFPLSAADVWRVMQYAKKEKKPALEILRSMQDLKKAKIASPDNAYALGALIEELAREATIERPAVVAEHALIRSGLLKSMLESPQRAEGLGAVRALLSLFEDLARREHAAQLPRALALVSLYEEREMSLSGRVFSDDTRVKVMTVHGAKGREFRRVFIPRLTESVWSTRARAEHFHLPDILSGSAGLEDERRLFYVALTRGKEHVTLSYAETKGEGRMDEPSVLLEDLAEEILSREATPEAEDLLTAESDALVAAPSEDERATLRAAFFAQGLSPTALNNYLDCPWHYFYVNLLRIPEAENKFMLYGTAVHAALKRYADERKQGSDIGPEGLYEAFDRTLERSPLTERELLELKEKGNRSLSVWHSERSLSWPADTEAELLLEAYLPLPGEENLLVRGALDRVDTTPQGLRVIDYKTGKSKSRNDIQGNTKESNGNYYRQLVFYRMLLARSETPRHMHEGVIEFVEPDEKDRIRTEAFEITSEEVDELEEKIAQTAKEILSLSFWNETCEDPECKWCQVRFG
ncbi:ATP-dependent helicase [Patescibacteria group bacterium]|nr:ATP-dependent helicase [Patescibacteria group bacterium]MBU2081074.1 ATP-dependent helicase [Patescibacteria group bacterium]MBU2124166.1 ATP-dependent helicase [Patescibacteria group bacterium]MBU2195022.1 ATP-dependent helicase [Patescibacteria group bacterium]MBU2330111.1 ATP-dependent helicase [Patescibacteria group bacterium]